MLYHTVYIKLTLVLLRYSAFSHKKIKRLCDNNDRYKRNGL